MSQESFINGDTFRVITLPGMPKNCVMLVSPLAIADYVEAEKHGVEAVEECLERLRGLKLVAMVKNLGYL